MRNKISRIWDEQGNWVQEQKGIVETFCKHFNNIYSGMGGIPNDILRTRILELNTPTLGSQQVEWLDRLFTPKEIKEAAFQIDPLESSKS